MRITYRGGDGNDVVIEGVGTLTYYLAEGATGDFFDDDVLIANPNGVEAPVTLTFLREGGATVVVQRVIPARSCVTIHVDQIEGLEDVSASVKVESINDLELVVERTMFWDRSYYGGHTANAVAKPEKRCEGVRRARHQPFQHRRQDRRARTAGFVVRRGQSKC